MEKSKVIATIKGFIPKGTRPYVTGYEQAKEDILNFLMGIDVMTDEEWRSHPLHCFMASMGRD